MDLHLPVGPPAAVLLLLVGCGKAEPPGTGPDIQTADSRVDVVPDGLQIQTLTLSVVFGWDGSAVIDATDEAGSPLPSVFRMAFGPPGWDGDTTLPGPPDNWCFVDWALAGRPGVTPTGAAFAAFEGLGSGVSNCGRESAPGAGDAVELATDWFQGDPVGALSPADWRFETGGPALDPEVQPAADALESLGYGPENLWGGTVVSQAVMGEDETVPSVVYGLVLDDQGVVEVDEYGVPVRAVVSDQAAGSLQPGLYTHVVPTVFVFQ